VQLRWFAAAGRRLAATLYRRTATTDWQALCAVTPDGTGLITYSDADVEAGRRYGYRLGMQEGGQEAFVGEVWVEVPALRLALHGLRPNPSGGRGVVVALTLPGTGRALLEVFDVSGRLIERHDVASLGPGFHEVQLGPGLRQRAGVHLLRLTQGGEVVNLKAVILQ
jgi:hypothetical protein